MKKHLYILTDSNRICLHVGLTDDLNSAINTYKNLSDLFFDSCSKVSRLVYRESFFSEEAALKRFQELSKFTRMQKERLIRRYNPNWIDLGLRRLNGNLGSQMPTRLQAAVPQGAQH